ncbi:MAG: hypothetical protein DCC88_07425 [Spirobacillus cienkowskii]|jgi:hypothetical protein|uniref:OmpA-like domain-containing protein n=1 Tax=Spirobacillus cienkowskii TaxID=495820 RepID=A0A369KQ50_9BACT|nr:MAG: hypothetical protein DCC88_07425 [Spirobacillus cienkowskii]
MNKVKIIQKTSVATIIMLFNQSTVYASDYSECIIEYSINSSVKIKNKEEFDNCLKSLKGKNIEAVVAIGGATPSGSLKRNKQLADERLKTTINYISNNFQNVRIKTYNVGVNDTIGKKVYLSFIMNDENNIESTGYFKNKISELEVELQNKDALLAASEIQAIELQTANSNLLQERNQQVYNKTRHNERDLNLHAAVRMGFDRVYNSTVTSNYLSVGSELSWTPIFSFINPELGAKFSTSISQENLFDTNLKDVTNAYGFFGVNTKIKGLIAGGRVLLGKEWLVFSENNPKADYFSTGGELRVGYLFDNKLSVFGSYALTEHIQMMGIELGANF